MEEKSEYEVIIIGGSYAGLSAAMALGRSLRSVLILDAGVPCNRNSPHAHNLVAFDGSEPEQITAAMREQVLKYHNVTLIHDRAIALSGRDNEFEVSSENGLSLLAKKVLLASGVSDIMPDIEGFAECWGKTVIHCPYCHGYEIRDKKTAVLAHGSAGFEMARLMRQWTQDLTLLSNGNEPFTFDEQRILKSKNIAIINLAVKAIRHENGQVSKIEFEDGSFEDFEAVYARAGVKQNTMIPQEIGCEFDNHGFIIVDHRQLTNIPGLFAAGDNTTPMRSLARAIAAGNTAGASINHELIIEESGWD